MFVCCNLGVIWLSLLINHRKVGPFAGGCILCEYIYSCIFSETRQVTDDALWDFFSPIWHPQVVK